TANVLHREPRVTCKAPREPPLSRRHIKRSRRWDPHTGVPTFLRIALILEMTLKAVFIAAFVTLLVTCVAAGPLAEPGYGHGGHGGYGHGGHGGYGHGGHGGYGHGGHGGYGHGGHGGHGHGGHGGYGHGGHGGYGCKLLEILGSHGPAITAIVSPHVKGNQRQSPTSS
ncbi:cold and drought-regulated protein CORA-like, partial [Penaeus monodon]|uniref:cold and drought-regulated protein CORA-like n=1 Tax=Penaeus monodon TaxID=6687 RepID=UPI0018A72225